MTPPKAMQEFFTWLVPELGRVSKNPEVQATLSQKLAIFSPKIRWEVGPHEDGRSFFAFSPGLDVQVLPVTEALAAAAPEVPGWLFLPAKPRKQWQTRTLTLVDSNKKASRYNLDDWLYYLVAFRGGEFFDVNLIPHGTNASPLELQRLGDFLVQSELGEKLFLEFIDRVNIVLPDKAEYAGNQIKHLYDQLLEQVAAHTRH